MLSKRMITLMLLSVAMIPCVSSAQEIIERPGWHSIATDKSYEDLAKSVKGSVSEVELAVVTEVGPTEAAKKRGITIPGNCVIGVFNNDFAVRILALSKAAMIEAPMRMYVTENEDGSATLSWKRPTLILMDYEDEGGEELTAIAEELEARFDELARLATSD